MYGAVFIGTLLLSNTTSLQTKTLEIYSSLHIYNIKLNYHAKEVELEYNLVESLALN